MALEQQYNLLLYFFLALLPFSAVAQTYRNISLGSSLTAQADNSSWASPSRDFAFGFQQIEEDGFLLAIWFNKIPGRTIVWSANGKNLAPKGFKVVLISDGWFVLNDPSGNQIWSARSSGSGTAYAAMLDSGNLVLVGQNSQYLWQSFDHPTDTILPGQVLNQPSRLVSRYLETNYSSGRFQFALQGDGNLVLYTTHYPWDSTNAAYWSTQVFGSEFSLVFNQSGYVFLHANNGSIINMISSNGSSTQDFYQRAVLEYDGVFRHYIYPKSSSSNTRSWPKAWSTATFIPSNICSRIAKDIGSGACGFNSYCTFDDGSKSCHCPPGYSFIDPSDVMKGCKQDFDSQSCDESSPETDLFDFSEMENTNWPFTDYEHFERADEDWCRQDCLGDCFCALVVFGSNGCWKKKLPLSNGILDPTVEAKALVKVRKDNSTLKSEGPVRKNDKKKLIIVGSVFLATSVSVNLVLLVTRFLVPYRFRCRNSKLDQPSQFKPGACLRSFTYEELWKATNGFKEELGHGAFSTVYKGVLLDLTEHHIAVKKLNNVKDNEEEFKTEVSAFGRTNHRNLVQLLGYCNEGQHKLLIYEFMSKGSLASFLFDSQRPTWSQRMQIALGTAKGLLYLHEECSTQIVHCDIKPQNVLLDDSCTAKLSDFGLAKILKIDQSRTMTGIRGTKGYVAPEWFRNTPITFKVDVYSYGVLLLEIICCRKSFEANAENENEMVLIDWAYDCFQEGKLDLLVKDDKEALDDMKMVEKYVMVARWCIQDDPSLRPTMKKVLQMLEGSIDVPTLPDMSSFTSFL